MKGEILDIVDKQGKWWQARKADGTSGSALPSFPPSSYHELTFFVQSHHRIISNRSKNCTTLPRHVSSPPSLSQYQHPTLLWQNLEFTIFTTSDIRITLQYLLMTQAMPNFTLRLAPRSPIPLIDYLTDISPRPLACTTATRAPRRARRTRCVYCTYTSCCIPSILSLSSSIDSLLAAAICR